MGPGRDPLRAPGPRPAERTAHLSAVCRSYAGRSALRGEAALKKQSGIATTPTAGAAPHGRRTITRARDDHAPLPTGADPSLKFRSAVDGGTETFLAVSGSSAVPIVRRFSEILLTFSLRGETLPLQPLTREPAQSGRPLNRIALDPARVAPMPGE